MDNILPHRTITHQERIYSIEHLEQSFETFEWEEEKTVYSFRVKIRYSNHCYSCKNDAETAPEGSRLFNDHRGTRVFCPDRYAWSKEIPSIAHELFKKPTSPIRLTPENNGYIFRLQMDTALPNGEKYYCFIRLSKSSSFSPLAHPIELDMYIESAYPRINPPTGIERIMFGRLAYKLSKK